MSILDLEEFESQLKTSLIGRARGHGNELWETIGSTNDRAAELARQGAPAGVIVLARQQTAGRGRQGRAWESPADSGIFMSVLLRPACRQADLPLHTLAAGVAVSRAVWQIAGVRVGLKWVNDIVAGGKKLGGILAEVPGGSTREHQRPALVVGIGINTRLSPESLPDELKARVQWLENLSGQPLDPSLLAAAVAYALEELCRLIEEGQAASIIAEWKGHSVTLGRQVRALTPSGELEGTAVDLTDAGALVIELSSGQTVVLNAGEITIRGIDGGYA